VVFAEVAVLGGIVLSLPTNVPVSPFVTAISFVIYLVCRAVGAFRPAHRGRTALPAMV
jgi:zinc/manganese transport system permease protein